MISASVGRLLVVVIALETQVPAPTLSLMPCTVPGATGPARCGIYEVWEDREARAGRRVPLHVLVLPALGPDRRADPLLFLQGGPGDAPSFNVAFYSTVFADVHRTRDLVFVDLRGTGRSAPLTCPELATPDASGVLDSHMLSVPAVSNCRTRLERQADLRFYTTAHAADDLAEVQRALGYAQVNLYGTSYVPNDWTPLVTGTFGGDYRLREQADACKVWPRGTVPPDHRQPLQSDIPTLLLSGELDPATPPAEAEAVLRGLRRGRHVVLRNNGHPIGNAATCTGRLLAAFIDRGSADDLDVSCASAIAPVPFTIVMP